MKRVHNGILAAVILAMLGIGSRSTSAGQLNLVPILQISGQYSDNVFFSEAGQRKSDTFFIVNPGIGLDYASKKTVASFAYQVGLQRYVDFSSRDNNVHRIDGTLGFNLSKGFFLNANDNLFKTDDPLAYDASGDRIQRDSFTYNHFSPGLAYTFGSAHDVRLAARYDRIDINYKKLVDSYQNGVGASLSGKLGSRSTVGFDFFGFRRYFDQQNPLTNVLNYEGRRYTAHLDYKLSPRVSASGTAGYEERKFKNSPATRNYDHFIYEASLTGEFPSAFSWTVGASLHLNDLAIRGAYKVERYTAEIRKSIADRLRVDVSGFYQDSNNRQIPEEAKFRGGRAEGQYLVAKFLNVWVGYEYQKRTSATLVPFDENRVNFGLTLSYGL